MAYCENFPYGGAQTSGNEREKTIIYIRVKAIKKCQHNHTQITNTGTKRDPWYLYIRYCLRSSFKGVLVKFSGMQRRALMLPAIQKNDFTTATSLGHQVPSDP